MCCCCCCLWETLLIIIKWWLQAKLSLPQTFVIKLSRLTRIISRFVFHHLPSERTHEACARALCGVFLKSVWFGINEPSTEFILHTLFTSFFFHSVDRLDALFFVYKCNNVLLFVCPPPPFLSRTGRTLKIKLLHTAALIVSKTRADDTYPGQSMRWGGKLI